MMHQGDARHIQNVSVRKRLFTVALVFFGMLRDFSREFKLIKRKGYLYSQQKMNLIHEKRARQLYNMAITQKGVLIKLCQFFSARRDIFPEPYIRILSSLQDDVPPISFTEIEKVLKQEYGDWKQYFKTLDPEPLASASLGQVHKGILHEGDEVVLKILKPDVEKRIDTDFAILFYVFKLLSHIKMFRQRADLQNVLDEFIIVTGDELNFKREAYVAGRFKRELKKLNYLSVPYVYPEYSTAKIIVMEYLSGDKINEIDLWKKRNNDPEILYKRIIDLYFEQFLTMKLIHFDPHPGNILVTDNNNLVLLDFGMSGKITDTMKTGIQELLGAVIKKDYNMILTILDQLGFIRKGYNKYSLLPVLEYFFGELINVLQLNRESIQTADLSPIIDELVEIIYEQPFTLPANWAFVGKTMGILSGIVATLKPNVNIYDELKPYATRILKDDFKNIMIKTLGELKTNFRTLYFLPGRINGFIENMERGHYKFHGDYSDIDKKIDELKVTIVRFFSFTIALLTCMCAYIFYENENNTTSILMLIVAITFSGISLLYRNRSIKERIKSYF